MREDVAGVVREVLAGGRLRPGQAEAIDAALERDTLAVLPSGSGKTLVYEVVGRLLPGVTLVVSPTIALQRDQLRALHASGSTAALLNADLPAARRREAIADFAAGRVEFLLLAPEQLANADVLDELLRARVSLAVVDEAHCVSAWGHEFRPDYLGLASAFRALDGPRLLALTATAPPRVRAEIVELLEMRDPAVVVRGADRPNIWLGVELVGSEQSKRDSLVARTAAALGHGGGPGIVYAATHRRCEELAAVLREHAIDAVHYHGGMSRADRQAAQDRFMSGAAPVIVATSAFGMGVDKPDVRFVYHTEPPETLDAYYQEIGRAGRDGEPATAVLLYRPADVRLPTFFAGGAGPDQDELRRIVEAARADGPVTQQALAAATGRSIRQVTAAVNLLEAVGAVRRRQDRRVEAAPGTRDTPSAAVAAVAARRFEQGRQYAESAVEMVRAYADTTDCRRRIILELLGEEHIERCGNCDNDDQGRSVVTAHRPYPLGHRVRHPVWGMGTVTTYEEGDRVVVLFDDAGYRTLALAVVEGHHLLTPADGPADGSGGAVPGSAPPAPHSDG